MIIVASLALTIFVYLAFPVIYITAVDKVPENVAKKYALINSICGAAIFMLLRVLTGSDAMGAGGFAPAVLYYFIAKAILKKSDDTKKQESEDKQKITEKSQNIKKEED